MGILKVQGKCPMGCGGTLFRADDGRVFCVWQHCPNPLAASELLYGLPVSPALVTNGTGNQQSLFAEIASDA